MRSNCDTNLLLQNKINKNKKVVIFLPFTNINKDKQQLKNRHL